MKKILISACMLASGLAFGQYDPEALDVLNAMSEKYKSFEAFSAEFTQEFTNENAGIDEKISGDIMVKGNKYLLNVAGQQIFNNGAEMWRYDEELAEVTVTIPDPEEEEISMSNIFDLYKEGFKYILMGQNQLGDRMIELDPVDRDKSYHKIKMVVNKEDMLKNFSVLERSGNTYKYIIRDFEVKSNVGDATFVFDTSKYPDVEIVDFR